MEVKKELLYTDYIYRQNTAKRLLIFADEALKGGDYFKNYKKYKLLIDNKDYLNSDLHIFYLNFLFENLRITTFFENFLKAFLLLNGKVVHIVNRERDKTLSKIQKTTPIVIDENLIISNLGYNTIGLGHLKQENYCKEVGLDIDFKNQLEPVFTYRNKVHFYISESIENPEKFLDLYEKVLSYSTKNIDSTIKKIDSLISDLIMLK